MNIVTFHEFIHYSMSRVKIAFTANVLDFTHITYFS